jgi:O-6-methylguanine DNA methyltransferase|nr:methylated-DNA--[protein]-cysteine S-methyltransferase [Candidatus Krumholzibacteria bacterium]
MIFTDAGWTTFDTAVGPMAMAWTTRGVDRLTMGWKEVPAGFGEGRPQKKRPTGPVGQVVRRAQAHLKGRPDTFADVPVDWGRMGGFSVQVLEALRLVGPGQTVTYGELARRCAKPGAARAVGRIMGANPVPLIVPCHRCLGADGSLTGFSSEGSLSLKAHLLHLEGHVFNEEHAAGMRHLARRDPVMRRLIKTCAPFRPLPDKPQPGWDSLVTAIVHQQLAVKAGRTIAGRVRALTPGARFPTPEQMLDFAEADLRAVGLSGQKTSYVKDLAARVQDGRLQLNRLRRLDDAAVIAELTQVRGIGVWSAQMHLMFHLGRLDVLPTGDLGLQIACSKAYGLGEKYASPVQMEELGQKWAPYRSIASWYLWRSLDQGGL